MHAARFSIVTCVAVLWLAVGATANPLGRTYSISEYVTELDRLSTLADQARDNRHAASLALANLRGGWKVEDHGQTFDINTGGIVGQFEKLEKGPDSTVLDQVIERIAALKADAQGFQQVPTDATSSRAALNEILARREFHQVQGPTWLDRLKLKIQQWIFRFLSNLFGSSSVPVAGKILVWSLVSVAVLVLAFFVYRAMKQNARLETIMPEVLPVSAKKWSIWMAEAQAGAAKGLWRDAVHLAYWAGISFLEESGMWRPDQARTPREYLKLIPASSEHRPALSTLTRQLEVTWYGSQQAGPETFAEALTHLENLGCRQ